MPLSWPVEKIHLLSIFALQNMNNSTFEQITENVQKSKEGPRNVDFEEMRQADRYC